MAPFLLDCQTTLFMLEALDHSYNTQIPAYNRRMGTSMMKLQDPWDRHKVGARARAGDQLQASR
jgi:hypothetical protein